LWLTVAVTNSNKVESVFRVAKQKLKASLYVKKETQKSSKLLFALIFIVVLAVALVAAAFWYSSNNAPGNNKPTPTSTPSSSPSQNPLQSPSQSSSPNPLSKIIFDFDTGSPVLQARLTNTPFSQTVNGVTASFSSPSDFVSHPAFSVQSHDSLSPTSIVLPIFSNNFLYPNTVSHDRLDVKFSRSVTSVTLKFSTIEYNDPGVGGTGSTIRLTAFIDSTAYSVIAETSTNGIEDTGSTYPEGTLSITSSGQAFNMIELDLPYPNQGASGFMIDDVTIMPVMTPN
jgi:cytoskeletal protein RodZ